MIGDAIRGKAASNILRIRRARETWFNSSLYDEHGWNILLHLFVALAANETISEVELIRRAGCTLRVGRAWLKHLMIDGSIISRSDGDDVEMTASAIAGMRSFLDAALEIGADVVGR